MVTLNPIQLTIKRNYHIFPGDYLRTPVFSKLSSPNSTVFLANDHAGTSLKKIEADRNKLFQL